MANIWLKSHKSLAFAEARSYCVFLSNVYDIIWRLMTEM